MITYAKLWTLLKEKNKKRTDLLEIISSATLAKLGKNEKIAIDVIEKICKYLNCQPGEIMEYIPDELIQETYDKTKEWNKTLDKLFKENKGMKEMIIAQLDKESEAYKLFEKGDYFGSELLEEAIKKDPAD